MGSIKIGPIKYHMIPYSFAVGEQVVTIHVPTYPENFDDLLDMKDDIDEREFSDTEEWKRFADMWEDE